MLMIEGDDLVTWRVSCSPWGQHRTELLVHDSAFVTHGALSCSLRCRLTEGVGHCCRNNLHKTFPRNTTFWVDKEMSTRSRMVLWDWTVSRRASIYISPRSASPFRHNQVAYWSGMLPAGGLGQNADIPPRNWSLDRSFCFRNCVAGKSCSEREPIIFHVVSPSNNE